MLDQMTWGLLCIDRNSVLTLQLVRRDQRTGLLCEKGDGTGWYRPTYPHVVGGLVLAQ